MRAAEEPFSVGIMLMDVRAARRKHLH